MRILAISRAAAALFIGFSAIAANSAAAEVVVLAKGGNDAKVISIDEAHLPELRSAAFVLADQGSGQVLLERNAEEALPIASITKLMTAMVVLDAKQSLSERLTITRADVDTLKGSRSRLPVGTTLTREELLHLALMASENRAASALGRHYPGGEVAFVRAMNGKAAQLGLGETHFVEATGLSADNVSSARDLVKMVAAAARYPLIREFSTSEEYVARVKGGNRRFANTNSLVRLSDWQIGVSKTGYIRESGRCLVMQTSLLGRPMIVVLLDSFGRYTRTADARRIRKWLESAVIRDGDAGTGVAG